MTLLEDIFKKQMLIFPVNYNLHWTALFVFHPGRLIRRHARVDSVVGGSRDVTSNDCKTETPESIAPEVVTQVGVAGVISSVSKCVAGIINRIPSPLKKSADLPQSIISNETESVNQASYSRWKCDYCETSFDTYQNACEHEKICSNNKEFCMLHFDSGKHFKLHDSKTIAGNVRKYLSAYYDSEYASTHPGLGTLTQTNLPGYTAAVPQQDNTKDCGVYMLEIIERMLASPPEVDSDFVKKKCKVFAKDLFGKDVIEQKRDDILQLVHTLREGQNVS